MRYAYLIAAVFLFGPSTLAQEIAKLQPETTAHAAIQPEAVEPGPIKPGPIQPGPVQSEKIHVQKIQPAGKVSNVFLALSEDLAREVAATTSDIVTVRDPQWTLLTIAQIGAAAADGKTSLNNFHACASCEEVGPSRFLVGLHPDAHKYIVAGSIEIVVEAVAAHYLRNHISSQKWYWRLAWSMPQSLSLSLHARAAYRNANVDLR